MFYGEILKKTRIEAKISQEEMAEQFQCTQSVISKLENNRLDLKFWRMIEWLCITKRIDIFILLVKGMEPEDVLKAAFTKEYLDGISKIKFPTLEEIEGNLKNADNILDLVQ